MMVNILLIDSNTLEKFVPICCIINIFKILSCSSDSSMLWGHARIYGPLSWSSTFSMPCETLVDTRFQATGFRATNLSPGQFSLYIYIYIVEKNYFLFLGIHT